ncbi:hypothetical protein SDC9_146941 [bioreactor metagenome]|uniref:Uncharacterized protein n=1 Tax=bioreactor metagenome TaxID=1076179 RepID=A0A645ECP4_9ZZZZ
MSKALPVKIASIAVSLLFIKVNDEEVMSVLTKPVKSDMAPSFCPFVGSINVSSTFFSSNVTLVIPSKKTSSALVPLASKERNLISSQSRKATRNRCSLSANTVVNKNG